MAGLIEQSRDQRIDTSAVDKFAEAADQYKQIAAGGKAADYFVKANPGALNQLGVLPEQWDTLGAREKSAAVTGLIKGQGNQELMDKLAEAAQQQKARANFQTFVQQNPDATPEQMLRAGATAGLPMDDLARLGQAFGVARSAHEPFFKNTDQMAQDIPGVPGAKRVILGGNESQIVRTNTEAPEAPPGYAMASDGKGGWKPVKIDAGKLTDAERAKLTATYEKNIDSLLSGYSFAKGDPEMESMFKERIAAHKQAIKDLSVGAPAAAAPANYKSPDEVKAAVASGALTKDAAIQILQKQFGMK